MANVLVLPKTWVEQAEVAMNRMLGNWWRGTPTDDQNGDMTAFDFEGSTSLEANGSNVPTGNYIVNADKLLLWLGTLTQEQLDAIKGRFSNKDLVQEVTNAMVDESTVTFYNPDLS